MNVFDWLRRLHTPPSIDYDGPHGVVLAIDGAPNCAHDWCQIGHMAAGTFVNTGGYACIRCDAWKPAEAA